MKRYWHWVALTLIILIVGVTWYRMEAQPPDPLRLFPSEQLDLSRARRTYVGILVVASILAVLEERKKRREMIERE